MALAAHHPLALLTTTLLVAACASTTEDTADADSGFARWFVEPASLTVPVGAADTLTITVLDGSGRVFDAASRGGWAIRTEQRYSQRMYFGEVWRPFEITALNHGFPMRYLVRADSVAVDTLVFRFGYITGCPDPPLCMGASWQDFLPRLAVVVRGQ